MQNIDLTKGFCIHSENYIDIVNSSSFSGVLDTFPAQAAYSLRKLSSTFNGNAIRVRRESDSQVLDIGFNSNNELDTAAIATFCGASNGRIAIWYDQSGNGRDASYTAVLTRQPIIYYGSTGQVYNSNNNPAIRFGNDAYSQLQANLALGSTTHVNVVSVVDVLSFRDSSLFELSTSSRVVANHLYSSNNCYWDVNSGAGDDRVFGLTDIGLNNVHIVEYQLGTNYQAIKVNGATIASDTSGETFNQNTLVIGANNLFSSAYLNGHISEFIVYAGSNDTSVHSFNSDIEDQISSHYGLI